MEESEDLVLHEYRPVCSILLGPLLSTMSPNMLSEQHKFDSGKEEKKRNRTSPTTFPDCIAKKVGMAVTLYFAAIAGSLSTSNRINLKTLFVSSLNWMNWMRGEKE